MKLPDTNGRADHIATYTPSNIDADIWKKIAPLVRAAVAAVDGTDDDPTFLLWANSRFVAWAFDRGLDVTDPEAVYRPEHRDRFIAEDFCRDRPGATRGSIRAALTRTGESATKHAPWPARREQFSRQKLKAPYEASELLMLERCAAAQTVPANGRAAEAFICVGLGVGPDPGELFDICAEHVGEYGGLVCVQIVGDRPRLVPVRLPYAQRVVALATAFPDGPLLAPWTETKNRVNAAARRIERGRTTPPFSAARFRNTWLLGLMADAVPNSAILDAAGLKTLASLSDLVPYLPRLDRADAMARLAGAQR